MILPKATRRRRFAWRPVLCGCVTYGSAGIEPVPTGDGVYTIGSEPGSGAGVHSESYQRAIRFCFDQGRQVLRLDGRPARRSRPAPGCSSAASAPVSRAGKNRRLNPPSLPGVVRRLLTMGAVVVLFFVGIAMFQDRLLYFPTKASIAETAGELDPWPGPEDFRGLLAQPPGDVSPAR